MRTALLPLALLAACLGHSHASAASLVFGLELASTTATEAVFDVRVTFAGSPADSVEAIQLSVVGGDPDLTDSDTDYSRFSFDSALQGWSSTPLDPSSGLALLFPDDPISGPFLSPSAIPYLLGFLTVDLASLPIGNYRVTLAGGSSPFNTDALGMADGLPVLFGEEGLVTFSEPSGVSFATVPEPSSFLLLAPAIVAIGLVVQARRRGRNG